MGRWESRWEEELNLRSGISISASRPDQRVRQVTTLFMLLWFDEITDEMTFCFCAWPVVLVRYRCCAPSWNEGWLIRQRSTVRFFYIIFHCDEETDDLFNMVSCRFTFSDDSVYGVDERCLLTPMICRWRCEIRSWLLIISAHLHYADYWWSSSVLHLLSRRWHVACWENGWAGSVEECVVELINMHGCRSVLRSRIFDFPDDGRGFGSELGSGHSKRFVTSPCWPCGEARNSRNSSVVGRRWEMGLIRSELIRTIRSGESGGIRWSDHLFGACRIE